MLKTEQGDCEMIFSIRDSLEKYRQADSLQCQFLSTFHQNAIGILCDYENGQQGAAIEYELLVRRENCLRYIKQNHGDRYYKMGFSDGGWTMWLPKLQTTVGGVDFDYDDMLIAAVKATEKHKQD